ncbi:hypothetical protein HRbin06_01129 [archaeon HR06]|nr:hypothetical protein HRbin06_01129 [archaeon HR06]
MMAKSLDDLKGKLLFNNTVDVWIALCREKGKSYRDYEGYNKFIEYLRKEGIKLFELKITNPIKIEGKTLKPYSIKLDDKNLAKIRAFQF